MLTRKQALRILNLLEQHHRKLGQILKSRHDKGWEGDTVAVSTPNQKPTPLSQSMEATAAVHVKRKSSPEILQHHPPRLMSQTSKVSVRDLSSSIAGNLASARGIPGTNQRRGATASPALSAQHASGRFAQERPHSKNSESKGLVEEQSQEAPASNDRTSKPSWAPPGPAVIKEANPNPQERTNGSADARFQHFYTTFESLISKLSAPLAFAGLPLTASKPDSGLPAAEAASPSLKEVTGKALKTTPSIADSLGYSQLISRAAIRAVHGGHSSVHYPTESFYVVPTTGGTISYADIMTRAGRESRNHTRHFSNLSADNDDFVDARETVAPLEDGNVVQHSGRNSMRSDKIGLNKEAGTIGGKSMEELHLQNQALLHLADTLSKRLHVFEMSAQSSSAALAQSIRSMGRSPSGTPETSRGKEDGSRRGGEKTQARITELEEILRKHDRELAKKEKENAKLKDVVVRYRDKWERLKEGARARREGGGTNGAADKITIGGEDVID